MGTISCSPLPTAFFVRRRSTTVASWYAPSKDASALTLSPTLNTRGLACAALGAAGCPSASDDPPFPAATFGAELPSPPGISAPAPFAAGASVISASGAGAATSSAIDPSLPGRFAHRLHSRPTRHAR